jgi:hypothetical protein
VKRRVECGDLRQRREASARSIDPGHGGRVVQWRKVGQLENLIAYSLIDEDRFVEAQPTVYHAVSDGVHGWHAVERRLELSFMPTDVAAFPAGLSPILNDFALGIQNHPFQTAGSSVQNKYGSLRHLRGE